MITIQNVLLRLNDRTFAFSVTNRLLAKDGLKAGAEEAAEFTKVTCPVLNQLIESIFIRYYGKQALLGAISIIWFLIRLSRTDAEVKEWLKFTVGKLTDPSYIADGGKLMSDLEEFRKDAGFLVGRLGDHIRKCQNLQEGLRRLTASKKDYLKLLLGIVAMLAILNSPHREEELVLQE